MLIDFRVSNFRCIRDEQALSLVPSGQDPKLLGNLFVGQRAKTLKCAAVFGSNASGKTSLLDALYVFVRFVVSSATRMNVGDLIAGIEPFALAALSRSAPSTFGLSVELEQGSFRYRTEVTGQKVIAEQLEWQSHAPGAHWVKLIDRREGACDLHEQMGDSARRDAISKDTRDNGLILSRAAERNVEVVRPLFRWFQEIVFVGRGGMGPGQQLRILSDAAERAAIDVEFRSRLLRLMADADTGISGLEAAAHTLGQDLNLAGTEEASAEIRTLVDELNKIVVRFQETAKEKIKLATSSHQFVTLHRDLDTGETIRFNLSDESTGTQRFLAYVVLLVQACASGHLIVCDELDASLHPHLTRRVIQMVQASQFNQTGAQLVFTTHDVTLMDQNLLRRDQVWLTEKTGDGCMQLYSLWDFENMPRSNTALAKNYLAGRFGAVPRFGPELADIPSDSEPTLVHRLEDI